MSLKFTDKTIMFPDYKWTLQLSKHSNLRIYHDVAPNLFYRIMQRLILGFVWSKNE